MTPAQHQRANALFLAACELDPDQATAYLARECGDDAAVADQVRALLAADALADDFLETAPQPELQSPESSFAEHGYRLLRRLGSGGMGEVWLAERSDHSFQQQVAIKLLHRDQRPSAEALRRFRGERQILAALNHPNVARLLDGSTLAHGAPFLVMEYIEGSSIDTWCAQHGLDVPARIRLFLKVCEAVQTAHQALIVHRDLKPSNVLVGTDGEPKLLDFGIAKVLDRDPMARSAVHTRTGYAPMTLAYASPEQVRGESVGTASDVYALGVLLYELLTGELPYRAVSTDPVSMARAVCEQAPESPSRQVAQRQTVRLPGTRSGRPLRQLLRGDLDAIVLKALRKEPAERYRSAEHLADDLRRHLDGLPVLASRGSRWYRWRKFVGRHRYAVAAALLLVALSGAFLYDRQQQLRETRAQRDRAEQALALLQDVLTSADPAVARGQELTARQILASGARKLVEDNGIAADLKFDLLLTVGDIESVLGLNDQAQAHFDAAGTLLDQLPALARDRLDIERQKLLNNRGDNAAAEALSAQLLARIDSGQSQLQAVDQASALIGRGNALNLLGRGAEAEPLLRRALALVPTDRANARMRAAANGQLGQILQNLGRLDEAEAYLRESLAISEANGFDPYRISRDQNNLAGVLAMQGRFAEALALHRPAIATFIAVIGKDHPEYGIRLNNLGMAEYGAGQILDADAHLREALQLNVNSKGEQHPVTAAVRANLAATQAAIGNFDDAWSNASAAYTVLYDKFGRDNLLVIRAARNLGVIALERNQPEPAERYFQQCVDGALASKLAGNPVVSRCRLGLAELALNADDFSRTHRLLDLVSAQQQALDPRHFERGMTALVRAALAVRENKPDVALAAIDAIPSAALNESWQPVWRDLLRAAASRDCSHAPPLRAQLALRYPQGHPRWQALCRDRLG